MLHTMLQVTRWESLFLWNLNITCNLSFTPAKAEKMLSNIWYINLESYQLITCHIHVYPCVHVCMCMCVCIYGVCVVCVCVCIWVCKCVYMWHVCVYMYPCVWMCVYIYICTCLCMHMHVCMCMCMWMPTNTAQVCVMCMCVCVCVHLSCLVCHSCGHFRHLHMVPVSVAGSLLWSTLKAVTSNK